MDYRTLELSLGEKALFNSCAVAGGIMIGWLFYDNVVFGLFIGSVFITRQVLLVEHLIEKRKKDLLQQFKDFLYSLSTSVSTGKSIYQGIKDSLVFWKDTYSEKDYIIVELNDMVNKIEKGNVSEIVVLDDFARRSGLRDIEDMVLVCKISKKSGGNFALALQKCSDIIGDKIALEKELQTAMIQKKIEGRIIAIAPFSLILFIKLMSPEYILPLYETNTGRLISTIALSLIFIAWLSIEKVNSIEI